MQSPFISTIHRVPCSRSFAKNTCANENEKPIIFKHFPEMSLVCCDLKLHNIEEGPCTLSMHLSKHITFPCWNCSKIIRQGWIWSPLSLYVPFLSWCVCLNSGMDPGELWIRGLPAATTYLLGKVSPYSLHLMKFPSVVCAPFYLHKGSCGHFWG